MAFLTAFTDNTHRMRGRGGLHSNNPVLAWLIQALDFGPATRPLAPWTKALALLVITAVTFNFLDGIFTLIALTDQSHPMVMEVWGPSRAVIDATGPLGYLFTKVALDALFVALMEFALRRGLPGSALVLSAFGTLLCGFLVLNSASILLSPPTF